MTYGCDSSFLMRILTNHPSPLARNVIEAAHSRIQAGDRFEISDLVLSETYYALQASYGVAKADAIALLGKIAETEGFVVSDRAKEILSVPNLWKTNPGFVDRLIHGQYFSEAKTTVSCEKSFKKLPRTEVFLVSPKSDED